MAMLICAAKWAFCWDFMAGRVMWVVTLRFNKGRLGLVVDKKKNKKQEYKNVAHYSQASLDVHKTPKVALGESGMEKLEIQCQKTKGKEGLTLFFNLEQKCFGENVP